MGKKLEDSDVAKLVSNVTQTMFGMPAVLAPAPHNVPAENNVALPTKGVGGFVVMLSTTKSGAQKLGSVMFDVDTSKVDSEMMTDSLRELINMAAGQIKGAIAPSQILGLPNATTLKPEQLARSQIVHLQAGDVPITVCIVDE